MWLQSCCNDQQSFKFRWHRMQFTSKAEMNASNNKRTTSHIKCIRNTSTAPKTITLFIFLLMASFLPRFLLKKKISIGLESKWWCCLLILTLFYQQVSSKKPIPSENNSLSCSWPARTEINMHWSTYLI